MSHRQEAGFSAIELLITLFVLAAFLIAGVQLYNVVINDGGASRAESRAANVAYNYLRQYSTSADDPCSPSLPLNAESIDVQGLVDVTVTVTISCPYGTGSDISKVEAAVTYNSPANTVVHATYVTDQAGNDESSVTDGLVAWWRLNGSAKDHVGTAEGTVTGATLTTGQNGKPNGAYSFNGTSNYIDVGISSAIGSLTNNFTFTAWMSSSTNAGNLIGAARTNTANGFRTTPVQFTTYGVKDYNALNNTGSYDGTWHHVAFVLDDSDLTFYVDGVPKETITHTTGGNANLDDRILIGATTATSSSSPGGFFAGLLDDLRIYDRVLSESEIQTLFSEGAF